MSKGTVLFNRKDKSLNEEIWDDTALIRMYEKSIEKTYDKIRRSGSNASLSDSKDVKAKSETNSKRRESMNSSKSSTVADWKVGDLCMAPYDDKWYPATILSIDEKSKKCKVIYNGYDEEGTVDIKDLLKEEDVEWDEDEPESALEDSAMDESQSSHTEDTTDNEKVIKKPREVPTDATNSAGTSETMPIPDLVPPPPPALFGKIVGASTEKEALTNMLMSWYMTGYHTGYFQAMRDVKEKKIGTRAQGKKK